MSSNKDESNVVGNEEKKKKSRITWKQAFHLLKRVALRKFRLKYIEYPTTTSSKVEAEEIVVEQQQSEKIKTSPGKFEAIEDDKMDLESLALTIVNGIVNEIKSSSESRRASEDSLSSLFKEESLLINNNTDSKGLFHPPPPQTKLKRLTFPPLSNAPKPPPPPSFASKNPLNYRLKNLNQQNKQQQQQQQLSKVSLDVQDAIKIKKPSINEKTASQQPVQPQKTVIQKQQPSSKPLEVAKKEPPTVKKDIGKQQLQPISPAPSLNEDESVATRPKIEKKTTKAPIVRNEKLINLKKDLVQQQPPIMKNVKNEKIIKKDNTRVIVQKPPPKQPQQAVPPPKKKPVVDEKNNYFDSNEIAIETISGTLSSNSVHEEDTKGISEIIVKPKEQQPPPQLLENYVEIIQKDKDDDEDEKKVDTSEEVEEQLIKSMPSPPTFELQEDLQEVKNEEVKEYWLPTTEMFDDYDDEKPNVVDDEDANEEDDANGDDNAVDGQIRSKPRKKSISPIIFDTKRHQNTLNKNKLLDTGSSSEEDEKDDDKKNNFEEDDDEDKMKFVYNDNFIDQQVISTTTPLLVINSDEEDDEYNDSNNADEKQPERKIDRRRLFKKASYQSKSTIRL